MQPKAHCVRPGQRRGEGSVPGDPTDGCQGPLKTLPWGLQSQMHLAATSSPPLWHRVGGIQGNKRLRVNQAHRGSCNLTR